MLSPRGRHLTWSLGEVRWRGRCEVLELDEKVATLHFLALNVELIVFAQKQASSTRVKVEVRFLRPGHRKRERTLKEWGASLRGSRAPLPGLLKPSPAVQMYDVYCGLASYGSYVSDLVIYVVMPFSSGLHISTSSPTLTPETMQRPPSSHRGAEGRWRCLRLLVASFGGILHFLHGVGASHLAGC